MKVRSADISRDLNELMRLAEQWLNPLWDKEFKREWLTDILHASSKRFSNHNIVVAEEENQLIGFVDILVWYDWLTKKRRLLIQHVYVDEDHRHKGVATEMLHDILGFISPHYALVDTKPDKFPNAEGLYKKVGFKVNPKRKWLERYG